SVLSTGFHGDKSSRKAKRKQVSPDNPYLRTVKVEREGITYEFETLIPSSEEELSKLLGEIRTSRHTDDRSNELTTGKYFNKYRNGMSMAGGATDGEIQLAALIEYAIEMNDTKLWNRIKGELVPEEQRLNVDAIIRGNVSVMEPGLLAPDREIRRAEGYFDMEKSYRESIASWLEQTFPGLPGQKLEKYLGQISDEIKNLKKLDGGFCSEGVVDLKNGIVVKIDANKQRALSEYNILSLDLGEFSKYAPRALRAPEQVGEFNLWTMTNVGEGPSGFELSGIEDEESFCQQALQNMMDLHSYKEQ
ncbi:MAG: hypothetical protein ACXABK_04775, partial [Candidatus Heimdallarchaeaceae archaeon]